MAPLGKGSVLWLGGLRGVGGVRNWFLALLVAVERALCSSCPLHVLRQLFAQVPVQLVVFGGRQQV